jgi:hypothetical protein
MQKLQSHHGSCLSLTIVSLNTAGRSSTQHFHKNPGDRYRPAQVLLKDSCSSLSSNSKAGDSSQFAVWSLQLTPILKVQCVPAVCHHNS